MNKINVINGKEKNIQLIQQRQQLCARQEELYRTESEGAQISARAK